MAQSGHLSPTMSATGGKADIAERRFDHFQPASLTRYDAWLGALGLVMRRRDFVKGNAGGPLQQVMRAERYFGAAVLRSTGSAVSSAMTTA